MKDRNSRQEKIKTIIQQHRISNQEELVAILASQGIAITQATLSRDLKFLRVGKVAVAGEGYFYSVPSEDEWALQEGSYIKDFLRAFVSIAFSGSLAVIKTLPGHANSLAFALDCLNMDEWILGTIAGDDTVLIVIREGATRRQFTEYLAHKFPGIPLEASL